MNDESKKHINDMAQLIYDKKGSNIIAIDISSISSLTDGVILAEGTIDRHVIALAKSIIEEMKKRGQSPHYVDGLQNGDWIIIDYMDFMIHIFIPSFRELYQLEMLWSAGDLMELEIKT
ncbi:MAG: ribosome silencing factor [Simkaniaceae bacterium]